MMGNLEQAVEAIHGERQRLSRLMGKKVKPTIERLGELEQEIQQIRDYIKLNTARNGSKDKANIQ